MNTTYLRVTSEGTLTSVPIPFDMEGYTAGGDPHVTLEVRFINTAATFGWAYDHTRKQVNFYSPIPRGVTVQISRVTKADLRYRFTRGARFNAANLEYDLLQILRISEEARNLASAGLFGDLNMQGYRLHGLADPQFGDDAVPLRFLQAWQRGVENRLNNLTDYSQTFRELTQQVARNTARGENNTSAVSSLTDALRSMGGRIDIANTRITALEQRGGVGGSGGGGGGNTSTLLGPDGRIRDEYMPLGTFGFHQPNNVRPLKDAWVWEEIKPGPQVPSTLRLQAKEPSSALFLMDGYYFQSGRGGLDITRAPGNSVTVVDDVRRLIEQDTSPLTQRANRIEARVAALEAGGGGAGGGGPGASPSGEVDYSTKQVLVDSPSEDGHAVNLGHLNTRLERLTSLLDERSTAKVHALMVETRDELNALKARPGGGGGPPPPPPPPPTAGGGGGVSFGVIVANGQTTTFTQGVAPPTTGSASGGTSIVFRLPRQGMWEVKTHASGQRRVSVSFTGTGNTVQANWGQYVMYTVVGYTGVSINVPPSIPANETFSLTCTFVGSPN